MNATQNHNGQVFINHIRRLPCQPSQSGSQQPSAYQSDGEGERAIQQFQREIEERFKLSVANKLYSFPRKLTCADDLISSDEDTDEQDNQDQEQTEALRPISKVQVQNKDFSKEKKQHKSKERENNNLFKRKQIYYVRENSGQKPTQEKSTSHTVNPGTKLKKKAGKEKEKSREKKQKQDSYRDRDTNRSKRFNTEPDSYNYIDTLRPKNKR